MLSYIMKSGLIWLLWIILFELLLRNGNRHSGNRAYLLMGLAAGLIFPLLPAPWGFEARRADPLAITELTLADNLIVPPDAKMSGSMIVGAAIDWHVVFLVIYIIGVVYLLFRTLKEALGLINEGINASTTEIGGVKVVLSEKNHSPFSFMGHIYIPRNNNYAGKELELIVAHELAHNQQRHYVDIIIIQLLVVLFWFNPLIWHYRYRLRIIHEYESDAVAGASDRYAYGKLLLKGVLVGSNNLIAHSFYCSPIKNRITMLVKNVKSNKAIYLIILPLLAVSAMAMPGKTEGRISHNLDTKSGIMELDGNKILWERMERNFDSVLTINPDNGHKEWKYIKGYQDADALELNGERVIPVYFESRNNRVKNTAVYEGLAAFDTYMNKRFTASFPNKTPNLSYIQITDALIDGEGRLVYYNIIRGNKGAQSGKEISGQEWRIYEEAIEKLVDKYGPFSLKAEHKGKPVFVDFLATININ